jgi:hypothetical protein
MIHQTGLQNHPTGFASSVVIWLSLCNLCVLCVSVVKQLLDTPTTETQRTQRLHREAFKVRQLLIFLGKQKGWPQEPPPKSNSVNNLSWRRWRQQASPSAWLHPRAWVAFLTCRVAYPLACLRPSSLSWPCRRLWPFAASCNSLQRPRPVR